MAQPMQHSQSILNEVDLSQRFSLLSSSLQHPKKKQKNNVSKQRKIIPYTELDLQQLIGVNINQVPPYLCSSNESFKETIHDIRPKISQNHLEELRHVAILMYKMLLLEKLQTLWITYRKSGMSELQQPPSTKHVGLKIWPFEIRSRIKYIENANINDDEKCHLFVDHCQKKLNDQNEIYRNQLRYRTSHIMDYTSAMELTIENLVQQRFGYQSIEYDCQISLVQYHYTDAVLKRQYLIENPNENQILIFKRLCKFKYEEAVTKYHFNSLKQCIPEHFTLNSIRNQLIGKSSMIDIAEQAKTDIMILARDAAERQMHQYQTKYNMEMNQVWQHEKIVPTNQRLTSTMIHLMEKRLANIDARLEYIYKSKAQLFQIKTNIP
ncbi:unnamed protein product [Rotaria socialis]|uniref:Uncharacterized protein n=1 Tax=Rotaria socialis TaxID=392032 RepID=A0A818ATT4_9BILA|nr:unnamed protein product [Rotaria socialis]CAF4908777.1 unnamed protein product [Rotaria socialis]